MRDVVGFFEVTDMVFLAGNYDFNYCNLQGQLAGEHLGKTNKIPGKHFKTILTEGYGVGRGRHPNEIPPVFGSHPVTR